ncbi:hypothetical protein [Actinomadura rudentiformis]|uniref:Uncharacterized protein n=1 Tax=Actinomadura rudentiformis TaxID=359158 RepID=A0A6H9YV20_9ACTN|nr:hypothetical protein [Actinomadura rudentiformis]KAB2343739.1 hypothetical protein F8566_34035 [Actinomadura rudentiformis]
MVRSWWVSSAPLEAGASITFDAIAPAAAPQGVQISAAAVNINARRPTHQGWLSIYGADTDDPDISSVNFDQGESTSGFDLAMPGTDGRLTVTNRCWV